MKGISILRVLRRNSTRLSRSLHLRIIHWISLIMF